MAAEPHGLRPRHDSYCPRAAQRQKPGHYCLSLKIGRNTAKPMGAAQIQDGKVLVVAPTL